MPHAVPGAANVTNGKLTGNKISGVISGVNGNTCHASVSGTSVPIKYANVTHWLNVNSANDIDLTVKKASGVCFGRINTGDRAYFKGIYAVSVPASSLTIS